MVSAHTRRRANAVELGCGVRSGGVVVALGLLGLVLVLVLGLRLWLGEYWGEGA